MYERDFARSLSYIAQHARLTLGAPPVVIFGGPLFAWLKIYSANKSMNKVDQAHQISTGTKTFVV